MHAYWEINAIEINGLPVASEDNARIKGNLIDFTGTLTSCLPGTQLSHSNWALRLISHFRHSPWKYAPIDVNLGLQLFHP